MLRTLSIRDFAIIDRLVLEFAPGLNVITGETGAGKSILIGALNLILGGRAGSEMVRAGADRAVIDAVFDIGASPGALGCVADLGFDAEDGLLYLTRELLSAGKSSARIGGRPAAVAQLKAVGDWLVDLHGQHEHQSLLASARHVDILDEWSGPEAAALRGETALAFEALRALVRERDALKTDERERAHLVDLYAFQTREIAEAALSPGEEEELAQEARRLSNAQKLACSAAAAAQALSGDGAEGAVQAIAAAARELEEAAALDERLAPLVAAVNGARYELEEASRDLVRYQGSIEDNPKRLEQIETRLEAVRALKRKYGDTIEEVLEFGRQIAARLDALTHREDRGRELDAEISAADACLADRCHALTALRTSQARAFAEAVLAELGDLAMERTRFEAGIEPAQRGPTGADRVEFLIAPNPGEPLRPLARIASGGEMSRVMLAIKGAMARQEPLPTMVFDEIDVGVGGRTAGVIAGKLAALARAAQVLCITHLPQIASRGGSHHFIEKTTASDRTIVSVSTLTADARVQEIARMLGGADVSEVVIQHAREMLGAA
ncbi:MAG: DNA repair protein RecN [Chthonomonadales bacterium]|nr:DNA repair protein RecN [Chthonomonadales bacterium]